MSRESGGRGPAGGRATALTGGAPGAAGPPCGATPGGGALAEDAASMLATATCTNPAFPEITGAAGGGAGAGLLALAPLRNTVGAGLGGAAGGGILSGFLIHFNLKLDADPRNDFASGPSNTELVAWDQSLRVIPIELRVRGGERLQLRVEHDHEAVRVGLPGIHPSMMQDMVGHTELVAMPGQQQQHPVR